MTAREAIAILGYGHPAQRGRYLSQADKDEIARLIAEQDRRLAEQAEREQEGKRA